MSAHNSNNYTWILLENSKNMNFLLFKNVLNNIFLYSSCITSCKPLLPNSHTVCLDVKTDKLAVNVEM